MITADRTNQRENVANLMTHSIYDIAMKPAENENELNAIFNNHAVPSSAPSTMRAAHSIASSSHEKKWQIERGRQIKCNVVVAANPIRKCAFMQFLEWVFFLLRATYHSENDFKLGIMPGTVFEWAHHPFAVIIRDAF